MRVVPSETNDGEVDCVSFQLRTHGLCFVSDGLKSPSQASLDDHSATYWLKSLPDQYFDRRVCKLVLFNLIPTCIRHYDCFKLILACNEFS